MESPISSAISISSVPSAVSDLESVVAVTGKPIQDKGTPSTHSADKVNMNSSTGSIVPEHDGRPLFDPGDGDIEVWFNGTCFEMHRYLVKRFSRLKDLLFEQSSSTALRVRRDEIDAEDFRRMLKVLYASILEGPFEFDNPTLVSALRIATVYDYPNLCAYAVKHLENAQLAAIERIKVAREFGLESWEEPAYLELCKRDEPITRQEAGALGLDAFVHIASIREREQRRRGKGMDADGQTNGQGTEPLNSTDLSKKSKKKSKRDSIGYGLQSTSTFPNPPPCSESAHDKREEISDTAIQPGDAVQTSSIEGSPSFVDTELGRAYPWGEWSSYAGRRIKISGCSCRFLDRSGGNCQGDSTCTITPCSAAALKTLQTQQIAHTRSIATLESAMKGLTAAPPSLLEVPEGSIIGSSIQTEVRLMLGALRRLRTEA